MNVRISRRLFTTLGAALAAFAWAGAGSAAVAAPVPVKVNVTNLRCIQTYAPHPTADDEAYLVITGVAKGQELNKRHPESGAMPANKKKPPVTEEKPLTLWEGELADGEFALVTVTLYNGKGDDAAKAFSAKLAEATKGVAERSKPTLASADEATNLTTATRKAQHGVVTGVKETLSREKNTDHFGGLFNVLIWNNNGTLVKRLDPLGLTFGEHAGIFEKIYTKIKWTLPNVNVKDETGEYFPQQIPPISEDKKTVRVKMLENDYYATVVNDKPRKFKNTTDYLFDLQLLAGGQPVEWKLGNEVVGQSKVHIYWDWAE